jgi:uncharacterized protein YydD (DUF2326 family)
MFLKRLTIENSDGLIRNIPFHAGLNLIVDETPSDDSQVTGNNVGKTTVLKLIDLCLGGDPKKVYTDLENPKIEYADVKSFLIDTKVVVTLTLCRSLLRETGDDLVISRNFLSRAQAIRRINGVSYTEPEFEKRLLESLFPKHYGNKPTFRQIISHNIRYKEPSVSNTLRTLDAFTRNEEYEALYLFLLGISFDRTDERQELMGKLRIERSYLHRLETEATLSKYEISLGLVLEEIATLEQRKDKIAQPADIDNKIVALGNTKYRKSVVASELTRLKVRRDLIGEAVQDVQRRKSDIDVIELRALYAEVSEHFGAAARKFEELMIFHNRMIEEKARYIAKDLPRIDDEIAHRQSEIAALAALEHTYAKEIADSGAIGELEHVINALNECYRRKGTYEKGIDLIAKAQGKIREMDEQLSTIEAQMFSQDAHDRLQQQLSAFNRNFSTISRELYREDYALAAERVTTPRNGQLVYQFSTFNTNNFSSGKKQGEITCFDIAYTLFADEQRIPCYHFLLNDKKELMHDNQLARIGVLVDRLSNHVQFVASILRDKLPPELNEERFVVVKLSQDEKLFRIENQGQEPAE